jgi:hypothetical protein
MITLFKIIEFIAIFIVIRSFFKGVLPSQRQNRNPSKPTGNPERFNGKEYDISDGDYEDI